MRAFRDQKTVSIDGSQADTLVKPAKDHLQTTEEITLVQIVDRPAAGQYGLDREAKDDTGESPDESGFAVEQQGDGGASAKSEYVAAQRSAPDFDSGTETLPSHAGLEIAAEHADLFAGIDLLGLLGTNDSDAEAVLLGEQLQSVLRQSDLPGAQPVDTVVLNIVSGVTAAANAHGSSESSSQSRGEEKSDAAANLGATLEAAFVEANLVPGDEFFSLQWHLDNTGQAGGTPGVDINVLEVWDQYTGTGVNIGFVDTGIQFDHPDLLGRFNQAIDYDAWDMDDDPSAVTAGENHATAVAGTIGATAQNGIGVVGVAFDAMMVSYRMEFGVNTEAQVADNMWHQVDVDISSNSWGFTGFFEDDFNAPLTDPIAQAGAGIENAVEFGRGGYGTVFVFSAGNGREEGQDVNYHSFQNSPYTIAVGGLDANGELASFSNPGSALLLSAPAIGIVTTDRTGADGFIPNEDYIAISGTSFSAPLVAGVVALMLEANPDLGYRDVQEILAYSSALTDPDNSGWSSSGWNDNGATNWNGGGLHFSHDYGFGLLDAHAAVRLAETWEGSATYDNLVKTTYQWDGSPTAIPDANFRNGKSGILESTITVTEAMDIDHVVVSLDLSHNWIGDLIITLTSPDGTVSRLVDRPGVWLFNPAGSSQKEIVFDLTSTQHWGETGVGEWTLTIFDEAANDTGVLNDWSLSLWGDAITPDSLYVFTDEFGDLVNGTTTTTASSGELLLGEGDSGDGTDGLVASSTEESSLEEAAKGGVPGPPGGGDDGGGGGGGNGNGNGNGKNKDGGGDSTAGDRSLLVDSDGGIDTINAAAVTTDTTLDLSPGATSQIAGGSLTIDANSVIENAYLGDGNDTVFGNTSANQLSGGLGDDWLQGREGSDTLIGGQDADIFVLEAGGGGADVLDADFILDFEDGTDSLGLLGLALEDLSFDNGADVTGDGVNDTVVSANGEFLAVVSGVTTIDDADTQTVTPLV